MALEQHPFDPGREDELDRAFRPKSLGDFVGQERLKDNLRIAIDAARTRGEPPEHMLFSGPPGLGKTSLASIIAQEMGSQLHLASGPALERKKDLVGILTQLQHRDVLFIDEIHRIPIPVAESLYTAMEDFSLAFTLDEGPNARVLNMGLKRFTLVGATTRRGLLPGPFLARFGHTFQLDYYSPAELVAILERSSRLLGASIARAALELLAARARGTPRIANRFLRRARDLAQALYEGAPIDARIAAETLERLGVDERGLEETDRRILRALAQNDARPKGLRTLSALVGEEPDTIELVYEPFLLREGLIDRTPQGRVITRRGYEALGERPPTPTSLFGELEP
jgi:Holliday junction DNA helicase RuvB